MEEIQKMIQFKNFRKARKERYHWEYRADIPWENRQKVPVFRGKAWLPGKREKQLCDFPKLTYHQILRYFPKRFVAVDYSVDHPTLLDARFSSFDGQLDPCLERNATNGLHKLLETDHIDNDVYFSSYQKVAVVLSGIGAAFRVSIHFVVLQECKYKEWYTPYLVPYVHYIPLSESLADLQTTMFWVKKHPAEVKQIAENGRAFYERYLTFFRHEGHIDCPSIRTIAPYMVVATCRVLQQSVSSNSTYNPIH